ncbi:MAG: bifunctional riboflavin kinase/FAD synthetase [Flavobacteriaceae bacterium]|nr:bifunctional riboflavin kinase/FAD synthetase [Flavobacteriaceae bacterium]
MKIYNSIYDFSSNNRTVATIGTFDGVHIGHKKIIEQLVKNCENSNYESVILTFFPHPRMVLQKDTDVQLLNTLEEKISVLEKTGINHLIIHPFDQRFSRLTAEEFVESILVNQLNIKKIIIGYDHRFGRNRTANINDLILFGEQFHFEVNQISAEEINDVSISSTKIRNALNEGNICQANSFLGYHYMLTGVVKEGKKLGRTIDYPTANIYIEESYKLIPKVGVYAVYSIIDDNKHFGMMNIGFNPTVGGTEKTIEINYFDFDSDLYGKKLTVFILDRIRDEKKFDSLELLKNQLQTDKSTALEIIKSL